MVLAIYACDQQCSTTNFSNNKVTSPKRFYLFMVYSRRDWLWKQANIKVENNGAVVYAVPYLFE